MKTLKELLAFYNTDKDKYHHYGNLYEQYLEPMRQRATSILEIGVWGGESLRVWRDFFPYAQVHGIDNNAQIKYDINELNINVHIGDQSDPTFLINVGFKYGPFDFICDDGSHQIEHQLTSLLYLFQFLKPNGIYAIEDIQDPTYLEIFNKFPATVHDLRKLRPHAPRDDILVIFQRSNVNYGFKCPDESCSARAHFSFMTPMNARPKCPKHDTHYIPDITFPDGVKVEDVTITPSDAEDLLSNAFPSSFEGVDERLVESYAELMKSGRWVSVSKEMGGAHYPIYMRDDRVLLGIQRLQACIQADTPFDTVMVRTYGYY